MDNETASHVKQIVQDVEYYWPTILLVGSAMVSWGIWWMRQMFATNSKLEEFIKENRIQHEEIKTYQSKIGEDVAFMRGKMDNE